MRLIRLVLLAVIVTLLVGVVVGVMTGTTGALEKAVLVVVGLLLLAAASRARRVGAG